MIMARNRELVASKVSLIHLIFALSCSVHLVAIWLWGVSLLLSLLLSLLSVLSVLTFPWDNFGSHLFTGLDKSFFLNGMEFSCCSKETQCYGKTQLASEGFCTGNIVASSDRTLRTCPLSFLFIKCMVDPQLLVSVFK